MTSEEVSSIELYHGLASTCSKKVRLVLYEKALPFESHLMDLQTFEQHQPEYLKLNPNGVVPTLVHRGEPIAESNVIIEYLDDAFPATPLHSSDALERARMRWWIKFSDDVAYDAVAIPTWLRLSAPKVANLSDAELERILERIPSQERRERWRKMARDGVLKEEVEHCYAEMDRCLARCEASLAHGPWLAGETYSLADIAMIPFVDRIHNLRPDLAPREKYPRLTDWYARMKARPAFDRAFNFRDDPRAAGLANL